MSDLISHSITVFLGFFAIMNPIANTAVFVGLTGNEDPATRRNIAIKSVLATFLIILVFCLLGKGIFDMFGITLPALRITGGILVFLVGYEMLKGENSSMHHSDKQKDLKPVDPMGIAISPLAIPILAGPGTIATAMNFSASGSMTEVIITVITFAVLCLITLFAFLSGPKLLQLIGHSGVNVITRLMGLILAVIGTQMLILGVYGAYNLFKW